MRLAKCLTRTRVLSVVLQSEKNGLAESDRPKQFEDTQGSGKNKKLFQFQNNFLKEPDEKVIKWPIEALPQDGALLKPRDE